MDPDEMWKNYPGKNGHEVPSPETLRFINTQREFNEKMETKLVRMEDKIDSLAVSVAALKEQLIANSAVLLGVQKQVQDQATIDDERITKLENNHNWLRGALAALAMVWSFVQFAIPYLSGLQTKTVSNVTYEKILEEIENQK